MPSALLRYVILSICMRSAAASRHVLSVSACCCSMRPKSGGRPWRAGGPGAEDGGCQAGCCAETAAADHPAATNVRMHRQILARIAPLYLSACSRVVVQGEPAAQMLDGFVWRAPIKRHHCARTARRPRDLRAPFVGTDRRHLDAVRTAIDCFVEAMERHGRLHSARPARRTQAKGGTKAHPHAATAGIIGRRSEERRVGKEC